MQADVEIRIVMNKQVYAVASEHLLDVWIWKKTEFSIRSPPFVLP